MKAEILKLLLLLSLVPAMCRAENALTCTTNNGQITITGHVEPNATVTNVVIPESMNGYPVVAVGYAAFANCGNLVSVAIPDSVTNVDGQAFADCTRLPNVVLSTNLISIGGGAFLGCSNLAHIIIPASVTSIAIRVFSSCSSLTNITFLGNAPPDQQFSAISPLLRVYYYYGTSGWGTSLYEAPTVMLGAPAPQISGAMAASAGNFEFAISGVTNQTVVVEASTNLVDWQPVWTDTLPTASAGFVDAQWTNYPARFYRAR